MFNRDDMLDILYHIKTIYNPVAPIAAIVTQESMLVSRFNRVFYGFSLGVWREPILVTARKK